MTYDKTLRLFSYLTSALFAVMFVMPNAILFLFDLDADVAGQVIARRAAILFLGITLITAPLRRINDPLIQRSTCLSLAITMVALAALGSVEFALGRVGPLIFLAVLTEVAFAHLFWRCRNSLV